MSMICIASVLVGLGCYLAAINKVPLVSGVLIQCSSAGLPLASSFERAACTPGTNAGRRTDDRNSLLHLHHPAGLLVGGHGHSGRRR